MGTTALATTPLLWPALLALTLSVLSGLGDAYGFVHAARIWRDDALQWDAMSRSAAGFVFGVLMQWCALRYLNRVGITVAETQTLVWFVVTMVGIAAVSGRALDWATADRVVAVGVVFGLAWLVVRTR